MSLRSQKLAGLRAVINVTGETVVWRRAGLEQQVKVLIVDRVSRAVDEQDRVIEIRDPTLRVIADDLNWLAHPVYGTQPLEDDEILRFSHGRQQTLQLLPDKQGRIWYWDSLHQMQYICRISEINEAPL